jgi:hypothetical protein
MCLSSYRTCFSSYRAYLEGHRRYQSTLMVPVIEVFYLIALLLMPSSALRFGVHSWAHRHDELRYGPEPATPEERTAVDAKEWRPAAEVKADTLVSRWLEINNLVWTFVLAFGVWTLVPPRIWHWDLCSAWAVFVYVVALIRICEILVMSAELILRRIDVTVDHTLATLVIYVIQTVAIFTIAAELVGPHGFAADDDVPKSWADFLYMTWNNMTTLGNSYAAISVWGRLVVAGSNVTAILLFSVLLGFAVGKLGEEQNPTTDR